MVIKENIVDDDKAMPLLDHLIELRRRLLWSLVTFVIAFFFCYHYAESIYFFLARPLEAVMAQKGEALHLIYTALPEAFFTYVRVAVFGGLFLSFPMIAVQAWIFIAPGLYRNEKRAFLPFLLATPFLFILGAALAYFIIFPVAWKFFLSFQTNPMGHGGMHVELQAKVSEYLSLVMKLVLAFGVAFELPVVLTLMARVGIISYRDLKRFRRYAIVGAFIIAAVLAPPDVITQFGLAVPLILLYEISIITARWVAPGRATVKPED